MAMCFEDPEGFLAAFERLQWLMGGSVDSRDHHDTVSFQNDLTRRDIVTDG
jgi:hypothetical protein